MSRIVQMEIGGDEALVVERVENGFIVRESDGVHRVGTVRVAENPQSLVSIIGQWATAKQAEADRTNSAAAEYAATSATSGPPNRILP